MSAGTFLGVSSIPLIQENVRTAIGGNMSLFCLGFGNDVDYGFLDVMAKQNKGVARRIYEASDATLQLQVRFCCAWRCVCLPHEGERWDEGHFKLESSTL